MTLVDQITELQKLNNELSTYNKELEVHNTLLITERDKLALKVRQQNETISHYQQLVDFYRQ